MVDGTGGGYSEFKIDENRYRVTFTGNRSTKRSQIQNYLNYRCAELTLLEGHNSFAFSERMLVADDGSLVHASWTERKSVGRYLVIPVGGIIADILIKGIAKGAIQGVGKAAVGPSGQTTKEEMGGVAQAVIDMYDHESGESPAENEFLDGMVYDARGVMRMLQRLDRELSALESARIMRKEVTPGTRVKQETWQKQLDESRKASEQLRQ